MGVIEVSSELIVNGKAIPGEVRKGGHWWNVCRTIAVDGSEL